MKYLNDILMIRGAQSLAFGQEPSFSGLPLRRHFHKALPEHFDRDLPMDGVVGAQYLSKMAGSDPRTQGKVRTRDCRLEGYPRRDRAKNHCL
jgi:hypothetical protein